MSDDGAGSDAPDAGDNVQNNQDDPVDFDDPAARQEPDDSNEDEPEEEQSETVPPSKVDADDTKDDDPARIQAWDTFQAKQIEIEALRHLSDEQDKEIDELEAERLRLVEENEARLERLAAIKSQNVKLAMAKASVSADIRVQEEMLEANLRDKDRSENDNTADPADDGADGKAAAKDKSAASEKKVRIKKPRNKEKLDTGLGSNKQDRERSKSRNRMATQTLTIGQLQRDKDALRKKLSDMETQLNKSRTDYNKRLADKDALLKTLKKREELRKRKDDTDGKAKDGSDEAAEVDERDKIIEEYKAKEIQWGIERRKLDAARRKARADAATFKNQLSAYTTRVADLEDHLKRSQERHKQELRELTKQKEKDDLDDSRIDMQRTMQIVQRAAQEEYDGKLDALKKKHDFVLRMKEIESVKYAQAIAILQDKLRQATAFLRQQQGDEDEEDERDGVEDSDYSDGLDTDSARQRNQEESKDGHETGDQEAQESAEATEKIDEEYEEAEEEEEEEDEDELDHDNRDAVNAFLQVAVQGVVFLKHGNRGRPHERKIRVSEGKVHWKDDGISFVDIKDVQQCIRGTATPVFQRSLKEYPGFDPKHCFSLVTKERSLNLQANSQEECNTWFQGLTLLWEDSRRKNT